MVVQDSPHFNNFNLFIILRSRNISKRCTNINLEREGKREREREREREGKREREREREREMTAEHDTLRPLNISLYLS